MSRNSKVSKTSSDASSSATSSPAGPTPLEIAKQVPKRIKAHNVVVIAAGIAFYGLLALVPTLIALMSIYALVTDPSEIADQLSSITENMEEDAGKLLRTQVETAVSEAKGSAGTTGLVLGIVLALFSASGALAKLMNTIAMAYAATETRKGWQVRLLAFVFAAGAIVGVAALAFVLGAAPPLADSIGMGDTATAAINILRFPLAMLAMMFGLTVLYRYGPDRPVKTPWKNLGAVVGAACFLLFVGVFMLYFKLAGAMPDSYGILGSIAALIIFLQLCAIAVVIGAEVNAAIEGASANPLDGIDSDGDDEDKPLSTDAIPIGTALAGLAAIFFLGRN